MNKVLDSLKAGFQWTCKEGALVDEPMRGIRFNLTDVAESVFSQLCEQRAWLA